MIETVLILFAAGTVGGVTVGSKVAMKEVEIMFNLAKSGKVRGNRVWLSVRNSFKSNKTWRDLKKKYRVNKDWNEAKRSVEINRVWQGVRTGLDGYNLKSIANWEEIKVSRKPGKFDLSSKYLTDETSDQEL